MGKARTFSDETNEAVYQSEANDENYVLSSQQNPQGLGGGVFDDSSGYGNFAQSGNDQRKADLKGALFRGNIGFELETAFLDFDSNTINLLVDQSNDPIPIVPSDRLLIISGINTTADLVTILGAQRPGQRLFLYGVSGNTITIKNTSTAIDNTILTPNGSDFIFSGNQVVVLVYDTILTKWRIVGSAGGGTTTSITTWKLPVRAKALGFTFNFPFITEVIDGVTLVEDDRVLLADEILADNNGIYRVNGPFTGNPSLAPIVRADDFNSDAEVLSETFVAVEEGTVNKETLWHLVTPNPIIVDTTNQDWQQFVGGSGYTTIQDEGSSVAQQNTMNFIGTGVTVEDNPSQNRTDITISGGGTNLWSDITIDTDKDMQAFNLTNLSGISLFANAAANPVNFASDINFISDGGSSRGALGSSEVFSNKASGAVYTANISNGSVISYNQVSVGTNYPSTTRVDVVGGNGVGATAQAVIQNGKVTAVTSLSPGSGYTSVPTVLIIPGVSTGLVANFTNTQNFVVSVDTNEIIRVDPTNKTFVIKEFVSPYDKRFEINEAEVLIYSPLDIIPSRNNAVNIGSSSLAFGTVNASILAIRNNASVLSEVASIGATSTGLLLNTPTDETLSFLIGGKNNFRFRTTGSTPFVHELFIGPEPHLSGEKYVIQMGENGNADGTISLISAANNDLIINRGGVGKNQGVQIRGSGLSLARFLSDRIDVFKPITNVTGIFPKSETVGDIGALVTGTAPFQNGFNYYLRDKIFWDTDPDTFIQFQTNGIFIESDDALELKATGNGDDATLTATGSFGNVRIKAPQGFARMESTPTIFFQVQDNSFLFNGANLFLTNGTEEIQFADPVTKANVNAILVGSGLISLFNNADDETLTVKKDTTFFHQVENVANLPDVANRAGHWVRLPIVDSTTSISSISIFIIEAIAGTHDGSMCLFTDSTNPNDDPFLLIKSNFHWFYLQIRTLVGDASSTGRRLADIPFTPHRTTPYTRDDSLSFNFAVWPGQNFPGIIAIASTGSFAATFWMRGADGGTDNDPATFKQSTSISGSDEPGIVTGQFPITTDFSISIDEADELGGPDDGSCCIANDDFYCKLNGRWFREDF